MADNTAVTPAAPQQGAKQDNIQRDQQGGEIRRNRNHRRRHGGQGQRQPRQGDENRQQRQGGEKGEKGEKGGKSVREPKEKNEGRENRSRQDQGQRRKKQFDGAPSGQGQIKREKRQRFIEDEREKEPIVKKVETIDDIRSDNARITKEIYQVIASMKDITIE
jgi:hypothetical protein